ncbi:unnamed protein product [Toxocara canis]|uniref:Uncharacterized protein n=1 Tax=Toxocara canis TaxID=6265 RepID=A0A183UBM3_TOXCA|nr:unnamed protein product [Toxocara canis]
MIRKERQQAVAYRSLRLQFSAMSWADRWPLKKAVLARLRVGRLSPATEHCSLPEQLFKFNLLLALRRSSGTRSAC